MINKVTVSRSETVPFLDANGVAMQMAQFRMDVSVEGDDPKEAQDELDRLFQIEKEKLELIVPQLKVKERRIQFVLNKLKTLVPDKYAEVMEQCKHIK